MGRDIETAEAWPRAWFKSGAAILALVLGALCAAAFQGDAARASQNSGNALRSAVPRFESLKSDRVPLRTGPGREFPITWVLTRLGLPVEVMQEVEGWRQVRDPDGTTGWAPAALLSARRTAVVTGKDYRPGRTDSPLVDLFDRDSASGKVTVRVEAGVVVGITGCDGAWCKVSIEGMQAFVPQSSVWGVRPDERIR